MNIARINQVSGVAPVNQSYQDNHEKKLQKQISNLQEQVKNIDYNKELSPEEKSDEKKKLEEKVQSLSSELKQYQLQKKQENARQQTESEKAGKNAAPNSAVASGTVSDTSAAKADHKQQENDKKANDSERSTDKSGVILSITNTKDQLADMHSVRRNLEGRMRIADTDEEKADLQKRINDVSKNMSEKVRKISDTISDHLKEEDARKAKIKEIQEEQADRMKNINVVVPNNAASKPAASTSPKENFMIPGDVSIS